MMSHQDEEDEGLLEDGVAPGTTRTTAAKAPGGFNPFGMCACLSVEYYRPYFDVNTDDVVKRLKYALMFCGAGSPFLEVVREKPDAYGPWWIATTLVFLLSVTSHLTALMHFGRDYEYDFTVVTIAATTVYAYVGVVTLAMWLGLNYWLKTPMTLLQCGCVVGYSLTVYLPASVVCVAGPLSWPALLAAWVLSSLFAVKSTFPIVEHLEHQKLGIVAGAFVVLNGIFMLVVKLEIYRPKKSS
mmetsp:Transcript_8286/g.34127  ORF Transcript_8286/g.34127 Transcript_8286/m.34127 type:complete len:242 (+) Transcript_8286:157-882(+)